MSLKSTLLFLLLLGSTQLIAQEKTKFHAFKIGGQYTAINLINPSELVNNELTKSRYGLTLGWRREKMLHQFINFQFGFNFNYSYHYYQVDDEIRRSFGFNNFGFFDPFFESDVIKTEAEHLSGDIEMPLSLSIKISEKFYALIGGSLHAMVGQISELTIYRPQQSPEITSRTIPLFKPFGINHFLGFGIQNEIGRNRFFFMEAQFKTRLSPEFTPENSRMQPFYFTLSVGTKW